MNKNLILVVLGVVLVGLIIYGFNKNQNTELVVENNQTENNQITETELNTINENTNQVDVGTDIEINNQLVAQAGTYEAYDPSKLALAENGKVVLFFNASWCPYCRALDKSLKENPNSIPQNLTILNVNYDNSTELKKKYGVTSQHTLVQVDSSGNLITKWSGGSDIGDIVSKLK